MDGWMDARGSTSFSGLFSPEREREELWASIAANLAGIRGKTDPLSKGHPQKRKRGL